MFGVAFKLRVVDEKPQLEIQHPYLKLQSLDITVKHNSLAGVLNTVLKWMNSTICKQLEKTVTNMIIEKSSALLEPVNALAVQYWPMLNQMVDTSAIMKGKERVDKNGKVINRDLSKELMEVEVEFMDGPIGLDLYESYPTEPAVCKVKRFNHGPRNSKLQAEKSHLIKPHDYIIAINGVDVTTMDYDKVIEMLNSVVRPFDVVFGREIMSEEEKSGSSSSSDSDSESEEKPKKKSKKSKKESSSSSSSSSDSDSESEEKPKKAKKSKKESSSSSSSSSSESEEEKPKKKAAKKESSSSSSSSSESEEEKPKKAAKKESSSSDFTESSSSEEEKPKKAAKKESSSSDFTESSSSSEEEKPKKKAAKKESSSSSSSSSESEEEKPKKASKKSKKSKKESSSSSSSSD